VQDRYREVSTLITSLLARNSKMRLETGCSIWKSKVGVVAKFKIC